MIPLLYTQDLYTFHAAMKTAVRLINSDDGILKDYELDVHYYDSRVGRIAFLICKEVLTSLQIKYRVLQNYLSYKGF